MIAFCLAEHGWPLELPAEGELSLRCPTCGQGAVRLSLAEDPTLPPAALDTGRVSPPADSQCTTAPAYGTDDEVEAEDVEDGEAPGQGLPYLLLGELGRGGMGVVYKARQRGLNRVVALKMILAGDHAGPDDLARFRAEAEAIARLKHPNIVQVFDIGERGGVPYFSLEFCGGGSLARKLRGKPLPPREAAGHVEPLARAMQAAHDRGILHRDLKPANVLIAEDGALKITDFGLAKKLDEGAGRTRTGVVMGTPSYMAPEQAEGKKDVGPLADVYALGAILYECLTGRPPFQSATALDTILQVISEEPVPPRRLNSKVPRDLEVICLKCLRKQPSDRYARAADLADDLRRYLDGDAILARPPGIVRRTWRTMRKRPIYAVLVVLITAGVLFGVYDYARSLNAFKGFNAEEGWRVFDYLRGGGKDAGPVPHKK
jgi:serine/threonine-protein kinase